MCVFWCEEEAEEDREEFMEMERREMGMGTFSC
jgi:hypothetical protein